ncbi:MAG: EF-P lysine aminoacylase GenX, partial [Rhodospirillaceae bacterium]|nr:EF-P lysine aminoacylase GenX [Rhodospirillaceae bacterium]
ADAREQQARFEREQARNRAGGRPAAPLDNALIAALRHGLPDCSGVAVGVDRLVSVAAGFQSVADSMSFPH